MVGWLWREAVGRRVGVVRVTGHAPQRSRWELECGWRNEAVCWPVGRSRPRSKLDRLLHFSQRR